MTAEKFGEIAADLWAARQRREAARKQMEKGLVIKRRGKLFISHADIEKYSATCNEVERLTRMLAA